DPEFSPDNRSLLFMSNKSGRNKMWIMGLDGSSPRIVLNDNGGESSPSWSSDGKWIAFQRSDAGQGDIWVVDPQGQNLRRVTNDSERERAFVWSPDSRSIAFISDRAKNQDIYVVDVASGTIEQLTTETNAWDETRWRPEWSPDSKWIAYVSNRSEYFADDLWLVEVATKKTRKVTTDVRVMSSPVWSPKGKRIALNGVRNHQFWYGDQSDIFLIDVPELSVRKLAMNTYVSDGNGSGRMAWSPDSNFLYFRYLWQGNSNLWSVPVDHGVATQMTYEAGSMRSFSVSPDGKSIAYARSTPRGGGEIYRFDTAGGTSVQLTDWVQEFEGITVPQRIAYRSTDGHYMQGYQFFPPEFDSRNKYPCLVQAHGGGTNSYGNGFHAMEHFMSQQGFVILAIEYRGGSGFGREFQEMALGEWSSGQGWDAVGAAFFLKEQPY
ncbi:MAG: S9 family peptidase, partial [Candidatus Acidiferrales bacterium]